MKERLQFLFAVAILVLWMLVVFRATLHPELVGLATVITPVMLLPAGWLFTDGYLRSRQRRREEDDDSE